MSKVRKEGKFGGEDEVGKTVVCQLEPVGDVHISGEVFKCLRPTTRATRLQ